MTLLLVRWGLSHGHAAAYVDMFRRNSFVHFMTFDFLFQALASGSVLGSDMERRGMQSRSLFWFVTMLPVIGLCLCLSIRPALPRAQA